jgi:cytochrome c-type protein NapB
MNGSYFKTIRLALPILIILFVGCSATKGVVYKEKGLVTGKPGMNTFPEMEAGETSPLKRPYKIAPPLVPHGVTGLPVNRSENECLECHLEGVEVEAGHRATKIPPSHFKNEHTGEVKTETVVGIRYNCLQCHVHQSEEKPPVSQMDR